MKIILISLILGLSNISFADNNSDDSNHPPETFEEVLLGITYDAYGVTFQVASNGCTGKENFDLIIAESSPVQISLQRLIFDNCRQNLMYGTSIYYSYDELGTSDGLFKVMNQIDPGRGHIFHPEDPTPIPVPVP